MQCMACIADLGADEPADDDEPAEAEAEAEADDASAGVIDIFALPGTQSIECFLLHRTHIFFLLLFVFFFSKK